MSKAATDLLALKEWSHFKLGAALSPRLMQFDQTTRVNFAGGIYPAPAQEPYGRAIPQGSDTSDPL